jgi:hypothetical protein
VGRATGGGADAKYLANLNVLVEMGLAAKFDRMGRPARTREGAGGETAWKADLRILDAMHAQLVAAVSALSPRSWAKRGAE